MLVDPHHGTLVVAKFGKNEMWPGVVLRHVDNPESPEDENIYNSKELLKIGWFDSHCTHSLLKCSDVYAVKDMLDTCYTGAKKKRKLSKPVKEAITLAYKLIILSRYSGSPEEICTQLNAETLTMFDSYNLPQLRVTDREEMSENEVYFLMEQAECSRNKKKALNPALSVTDRLCLIKCKECDERFHRPSESDEHFLTHQNWYWTCYECEAFFGWKRDAERHIREQHPVLIFKDAIIDGFLFRKKVVRCADCDLIFPKGEYEMELHMYEKHGRDSAGESNRKRKWGDHQPSNSTEGIFKESRFGESDQSEDEDKVNMDSYYDDLVLNLGGDKTKFKAQRKNKENSEDQDCIKVDII